MCFLPNAEDVLLTTPTIFSSYSIVLVYFDPVCVRHARRVMCNHSLPACGLTPMFPTLVYGTKFYAILNKSLTESMGLLKHK